MIWIGIYRGIVCVEVFRSFDPSNQVDSLLHGKSCYCSCFIFSVCSFTLYSVINYIFKLYLLYLSCYIQIFTYYIGFPLPIYFPGVFGLSPPLFDISTLSALFFITLLFIFLMAAKASSLEE